MELDKKLEETLGAKAAGMILDFASYSIITEGNAAQYYSDYAYNHPLFTPDIKIYSDSTISDDSTNKNCEAGNISMVELLSW